MGEVTDLVLEGHLCQNCGVFISEIPTKYPRDCEDCEGDYEND